LTTPAPPDIGPLSPIAPRLVRVASAVLGRVPTADDWFAVQEAIENHLDAEAGPSWMLELLDRLLAVQSRPELTEIITPQFAPLTHTQLLLADYPSVWDILLMANAPGPAAAEQLDEPLDERDLDPEDLAALRAAIREGRAEIACGEGIPLDEVLAEFDTPDAG